MKPFETGLRNWAVVSYKDDTGLGRMAEDARRVLGIQRQIVMPSRRLAGKALGEGEFLLSPDRSEIELRDFLGELEGLVVFEKADWTSTLLPIAKEMKLPIAAVPMWEWFRRDDPLWACCDLLVCPNDQCFEIVSHAGFENVARLPWALDLARLPHRVVTGPGRAFIHNAGLVDQDDRKGTRDTITAFAKASCSDARLLVRIQQTTDLPPWDERTEVRIGNTTSPRDLWATGDVAIQPSKMEGIGLMVLEPICAGIPVITLDAPPMNEYAAELLAEPRWLSRNSFAAQWAPQARLRIPAIRSLVQLIERASQMDLSAISLRQRSWAEETFNAEKLRTDWSRLLTAIPQGHSTSICI